MLNLKYTGIIIMETLPKSRAVVVVALVHCLDLYKMYVLYSAAGCSCSRSKSQSLCPCGAADFSENVENYYCFKIIATISVEIIGNHVSEKYKRERKQKHFNFGRFLLVWLPLIYLLELDLDFKMTVAGSLEEKEQLLKPETTSSGGMMDALTEATPPAHEAGAVGTVRDEGVERGHTTNPELRSQIEKPLGLRGPRGEGKLHDLAVSGILPWKIEKLQTGPHLYDVTTWKRDLSTGSCGCWRPLTSHTHGMILTSPPMTGHIWASFGNAASITSELKALASTTIPGRRDHRDRTLVVETGNTGTELPSLLQGKVEIVLRSERIETDVQKSQEDFSNTSFSASYSSASLWRSVSKNLKTQGTQDLRDSMTKEQTLSMNPSNLSRESSAPARGLLSRLQARTNRFQSDRESRNLFLPHISWHLALLSRGAAGSSFDINLIIPGQLGTEAAPTPTGQYGKCHDEIPQDRKGLNLSQWGELQLQTATSQSDMRGAKSIRALIVKYRAPSSRKILAS